MILACVLSVVLFFFGIFCLLVSWTAFFYGLLPANCVKEYKEWDEGFISFNKMLSNWLDGTETRDDKYAPHE